MGAFYRFIDTILGRNQPQNEAEAIERFQKETEGLLEQLLSPIECEKAADALIKITTPYTRLLKYANRYPEDSEPYRQIFQTALIPTLDKISRVSGSHQCFKNKRFKKAFNQFIRNAQKKLKTKETRMKDKSLAELKSELSETKKEIQTRKSIKQTIKRKLKQVEEILDEQDSLEEEKGLQELQDEAPEEEEKGLQELQEETPEEEEKGLKELLDKG